MWAHLCRLPPCSKFPRSSRHSLSRPTPSSCPLLLPLPHSRSSGHSSPAAAHLKGRPTQRVPYGGRPTSPGRTPPQSLCTEHDRQGGGVGSRQSRAPAPRSVLRALAAARCPRLRCPALPFHSGSYGADITPEKLKDFHRRRLQVLASAVPDLIAFEAIPNKMEAQALVELLEEEKVQVPSWICFSSVDGKSLCSGESFADCLKILNASEKVAVVGVNCTPPQFIEGIICEFRKQTKKAIAVYPNSGEVWDGRAKRWLPVECLGHKSFDALAKRWQEAGASLIGGCCRTTPSTIRAVSKNLKGRTGH